MRFPEQPLIHPIALPKLEQIPQRGELGGLPFYHLPSPGCGFVYLTIYFRAGRYWELKKSVARCTAKLLKAGTQQRNEQRFNEDLEYFGAHISVADGLHETRVNLSCLSQFLPQVLELLQEMMLQPAFGEAELQKLIKRNIQKLKIDLTQGETVAYRSFTERLFGTEHPYGYNSTVKTYKAVQVDDVQEHHRRCYQRGQCFGAFLCGDADEAALKHLEQFLLSLPDGPALQAPILPELPPFQGYELLEQRLAKKENSQQVSLRLGGLSIPMKHPDYKPLQMLYGALGGYMGSRLMQNLREKHGYTYGVYVERENYPQYSVQYIAGDFIFEHRDKVLEQIFVEIDRLQQEPMPEEELQDFKRFLKGSFSSRLDGISNLNRFYAGLIAQDQKLNLSHVKFEYLETVSAEQLQQLAQQYLHKDKMLAVMVY